MRSIEKAAVATLQVTGFAVGIDTRDQDTADRSTRMNLGRLSMNQRTMSNATFTDDEIIAFLDEMLPSDRMTAFETALRDSEELQQRFAAVSRRRDQGAHTVGEIWRRRQLSCPSRTELGSFLLGTLSDADARYVEFHLRTIGCRYCVANLADLEGELKKSDDAPRRRRKFFESSAGYLNR